MILNLVEKIMMNNPVRAAVQLHYESAKFLRMGGVLNSGKALELGCGRGVGAEIIIKKFGASQVDAFDLDPKMVSRAESRLKKYGDKVKLWKGDICEIPADENAYDAVFDFGVIHHVPQWEFAINEIYRVLKPNGRLYCEEVYRDFILHPVWKRLLKHPLENRFDHSLLKFSLENVGFKVTASESFKNYFGWFIAVK